MATGNGPTRHRAANISDREVTCNIHTARAMIAGGLIAFATVMAIGVVSMREPIASVITSNLPPSISGD